VVGRASHPTEADGGGADGGGGASTGDAFSNRTADTIGTEIRVESVEPPAAGSVNVYLLE